MCRYDLDDMDLHWLHALNQELDHMGEEPDPVFRIQVLELLGP